MPAAPYPIPRRPTALPVVLAEQTLLLFQQLRWELSVLTALVALSFLLSRLTYTVGPEGGPFILFIPPYLLLGIYWGLAVWRVEEDPSRSYLWSAPVERSRHTRMRLLAGGLLLLGGILAGYSAGSLLQLLGPGAHRGLMRVETPGPLALWTVNTVGMLNAYLIASLFALRTRHPGRWLFLWLPAAALAGYALLRLLALDVLIWFFGDLLLLVLLAPAAGTGMPLYFSYNRLAAPLIVLLPLLLLGWLILMAVEVSRLHREA